MLPLFQHGATPSWENPELLQINQLPAHADFLGYDKLIDARKGDPIAAGRKLCLNGEWSFRYFERPAEVPNSVLKPAPKKTATVAVPGNWTRQGYGFPHYTNTGMPFTEDYPTVPNDNPVGVYQREIAIPKDWKDQRICIHFGGAESVLYVYLDGQVVGMAKDSRLPSEFDLTPYVKAGQAHTLTAAVIKWSDATFIENQDQWWMGGLHREVFLYTTNSIWIQDVFAKTDFDPAKGSGMLKLTVKAGFPEQPVEGCTATIQLYDPRGKKVWKKAKTAPVSVDRDLHCFDHNQVRFDESLPKVDAWSAETPELYQLAVTLKSPGGLSESTVLPIGFKRIEVRDGECLVNGKAVIFHGVNRHEHDGVTGKAIRREDMERDVRLMKQHNFNAVRTAHYPDDSYFYQLCDEYGLYVIDEANIEAHAYHNSICNEPRYALAFLDRVKNMVERDKNHASIIFWSLGNESGHGANHDAAAAWVRYYDDSRLVHYEGGISMDQTHVTWHDGHACTDIICPMYPPHQRLLDWAHDPQRDPRPVILCEYSHAMGNSNGCLGEYYDIFRTEKGIQGGFIWEWCDHALLEKTKDGEEYWAYGGDFGDTPNDANFVCDGLVGADRTLHPGILEFKYLAQPLAIRLHARTKKSGTLEIENRRDFSGLGDLDCQWTLLSDGRPAMSGRLDLPDIAPGQSKRVKLALPEIDDKTGDWHLNFDCTLKANTRYAPKGTLMAWEQIELSSPHSHSPLSLSLATRHSPPDTHPSPLEIGESDEVIRVQVGSTSYEISKDSGQLTQINSGEQALLTSPLRLNLWRAPTDNDGVKLWTGQDYKALGQWLNAGLHEVRHELKSLQVTKVSRSRVQIDLVEQIYGKAKKPAFRHEMRYIFTQRGELQTQHQLKKLLPNFPGLARVGLELGLSTDFTDLQWYGRGPWDNYPDRKRSTRMGEYASAVREQYVPYVMPQEHGHHCDTAQVVLSGPNGEALIVRSKDRFGFAAREHSDAALFAATHTYDLKKPEATWLYLDHLHRGIGTASCGPDTLPQYKIDKKNYSFGFTFQIDSSTL